MTSDNHNGLTTYQRAILTHLGIVPWQLKSNAADIVEIKTPQTANNPIQPAIKLEQIKPSQERSAAGLEKFTTSIVGQSLILVGDNNKNLIFMNDVMQAVGFETDQYRFAQLSKGQEYSDFRFLWSVLETPSEQNNNTLAELVGHHLTTMQINSENAVALKKQLWQILQNYTIQP